MLAQLEQATSLGPVKVVQVAGNRLLLQAPEARIWALLALPYVYQAAVGDTVLVIGQNDAWYVIGVLNGTGRTVLTAASDLEIRAPHGQIDISSGQGIRLRSPTVRVVADRLTLLARSLAEHFGSVTRRVQETFSVLAGRLRTSVTGDYQLRAEKIVERAKNEVKINGQEVLLG
jgi:hypothetical protein